MMTAMMSELCVRISFYTEVPEASLIADFSGLFAWDIVGRAAWVAQVGCSLEGLSVCFESIM